jgi:hypothetical protein
VQTPQLLVCERDRKTAPLLSLLRETALVRGWWLREVQELDACLRLLAEADPGVVVLEVGGRLAQEFALIDRVKATRPEAAIVVVGESDNVTLANLAWELGADYVLFPPLPLELLPEVVVGLMRRVMSPTRRPAVTGCRRLDVTRCTGCAIASLFAPRNVLKCAARSRGCRDRTTASAARCASGLPPIRCEWYRPLQQTSPKRGGLFPRLRWAGCRSFNSAATLAVATDSACRTTGGSPRQPDDAALPSRSASGRRERPRP